MSNCTCPAVTTKNGKQFPHRYSRSCFEYEREQRDNAGRGERTQAEIDAEMLYLHDSAEARAINSGAW